MRLPDFLHFEPFNQLREGMSADELGDFVFFDPKSNLTGLERLALEQEGLPVSLPAFRALSDSTLAFKDSRILLYQPEGRYYHLGDCAAVTQLMSQGDLKHWRARVNDAHIQQQSVCSDCLQRLRYQHFDAARHRHREYSERVQQDFDLTAFFERYPVYPIDDRRSGQLF